MIKRAFVLCVAIILTFCAGCSKNEDAFKPDEIVEISVSEVENKNGLTKEEAEKLCIDVLGDKAEETGFPISYRCIGAVSAKGKSYYVMYIAWLVEGSHWSYIGNCYVSSDGSEIYDGIVEEGKYEMTALRWKK